MNQVVVPLVIRRLEVADGAAYRSLRQRGLVEHPEAFRSSAEEEAASAPGMLERRLGTDPRAPHDVVLGAFEADTLVGIVGMSVDPRLKVRHRGHVFGMYVPAEHMGRGVGGALLDALLRHARSCAGIDSLVLTVTDGNARPQRLYERAGFVTFGVEPGAIRVEGRYRAKRHMLCML